MPVLANFYLIDYLTKILPATRSIACYKWKHTQAPGERRMKSVQLNICITKAALDV